MSIQFVKGNLLNWKSDDGASTWNTIVHGVNCKGVYSAGLALSIRSRYPAAYEKYMEAYNEKWLEPATFSVATVDGDKKIVNLATQDNYGTDKCQLDYTALKEGMTVLRDVMELAGKEGRIYSLGIPFKIGCGLAGGNWEKVKLILTEVWEKSNIQVYIVEFNPQV